MHWRSHKAKEPEKEKRSLVDRLRGKRKDGKKREDSGLDAKHERKNELGVSGWISSKTANKSRDGNVKAENQEVNKRGREGTENVQKISQRIPFLGEKDKKNVERMTGGNKCDVRRAGSAMFVR